MKGLVRNAEAPALGALERAIGLSFPVKMMTRGEGGFAMRHVLAVRPPAQRLVRVFRRQPLPAKVWRACRQRTGSALCSAVEQYYLVFDSVVNDLHQDLVFERFSEKGESSRVECGLAH